MPQSIRPELLPLPDALRGERVVLRAYRAGDGDDCGGTGLHGFDRAVPSLEPGYFLHKGARGRGDGTEAVRRVTAWGRRDLWARRIRVGCDTRNECRWKLLERCGYRREATLRNERRDHRGELRDTYRYAVTQ